MKLCIAMNWTSIGASTSKQHQDHESSEIEETKKIQQQV